MSEMISRAMESVTDVVLQALAREEAPTPAARQVAAAPLRRDRSRRHPPGASSRRSRAASRQWPAIPRDEHPGWLLLFGEAAAVSDDDRLQSAARDLIASLRSGWGRESRIDIAAAGVDACLRLSDRAGSIDILQAAIDELERVVGGAYRPGEGVSRTASAGGGSRGRLADQMAAASALLTAFEHTSRLPYSMLAEELVQFSRRTLWDADAGGFFDGDHGAKPFALNCEAASVLCRLALLHGSDEYQSAAVVASGADYGRDAAQILRWLAPSAPDLGLAGAVYGLAAGDWQSVL